MSIKTPKLHPTLKRFLQRAKDERSTSAQTTRGLVNWYRAHPRKVQRWAGAMGRPANDRNGKTAQWWCQDEYGYTRFEPPRKIPVGGWKRNNLSDIDKEKRRIKHDKIYRASRIRTLRSVCRVSATAYSPERWEKAVAAERIAQSLGLPCKAEERNVWAIPVSSNDVSYKPTAKEATCQATLGLPSRVREPGQSQWKNGRVVSYTRATDDSYVLSAARLSNAILTYFFQEPAGEREVCWYPAPEGTRWDHDANGVRLVRGADDYHPTSQDLRMGMSRIVGLLEHNAMQRAKIAAENVATLADTTGVKVSLQDSINGGNCEGGTLAWAKRYGITDRNALVEPAALLRLVDNRGDVVRVRCAIRAAVARHYEDLDQGVDAVRTA